VKFRTVFCSGVLGIALGGSVLAQSVPTVTMDLVMTGEQLRTTGVDRLSAVQRAALDRWLSEYTVRVIQFAQGADKPASSNPGSYAGSNGGHWIRSKADNGAMVTFEDGSLWEINPLDRIDTVLWLPVDNITVMKASSPVGDYKYTLINTKDGEKALAKYLGKQ
jgi:hypothetical protein